MWKLHIVPAVWQPERDCAGRTHAKGNEAPLSIFLLRDWAARVYYWYFKLASNFLYFLCCLFIQICNEFTLQNKALWLHLKYEKMNTICYSQEKCLRNFSSIQSTARFHSSIWFCLFSSASSLFFSAEILMEFPPSSLAEDVLWECEASRSTGLSSCGEVICSSKVTAIVECWAEAAKVA